MTATILCTHSSNSLQISRMTMLEMSPYALEEKMPPLTALINDRIADVTHVGLTCWGLGYERAVDVAAWNAVTWGNVGFTVSLAALPTP